jgi:hypothetical protein
MTEEEKIAQMNAALANLADRFTPERVFREGTPSSRVFISYCGEDSAIAARLHSDLSARSCTVWQFEASAVPGSDAWDVILDRIKNSDYFVVLISHAANRSKGVKEEISFAHYQMVNNDSPKLIPLILADEAAVPDKLAKLVALPFAESNYEGNFEKVLRRLHISDSPFATTDLADATFAGKKEFDVRYEAEVFASNLVRSHPKISGDFKKLCAASDAGKSGHFRVWPAESIIWETERFREHLPGGGFFHRGCSEIFVIFPLNWGISNGNGSREKIIAHVTAKFERTYSPGTDRLLISNQLRLIFGGFRAFDISLVRPPGVA